MHTVRPTKFANAKAVRMRLDHVFIVSFVPRVDPLRAPALSLPMEFWRLRKREAVGWGHELVTSIMNWLTNDSVESFSSSAEGTGTKTNAGSSPQPATPALDKLGAP